MPPPPLSPRLPRRRCRRRAAKLATAAALLPLRCRANAAADALPAAAALTTPLR
jgi:hypothetical protein